MKLWRKLAKKTPSGSLSSVVNIHTGEVVGQEPIMERNGREIKNQIQWAEMMGKTAKKSYPLLDALFAHIGMRYVLTAKQVEALKTIKERNGENTNEVE